MKRIATIAFLVGFFSVAAFAQHADHPDLVAMMKTHLLGQHVDLSGPCGAFQITKRVAWALRNEGAGLLAKPNGNNCEGYSVDYLVYQDGTGYDLLSDAGGSNGPQWGGPETGMDVSRWRAPIDPGDAPAPTPSPAPAPSPSVDLQPLLDRIGVLEQSLANLKNMIENLLQSMQEEERFRADRDAELNGRIDGLKLPSGCTVQWFRCRLAY